LDASFLIPTLVEDQESDAVNAYLVTAERELLVSEFAAAEVASALSRLVRTGLLASVDARARLADFDSWRAKVSPPVDIEPADVRLAHTYVRRFELMLRTADALHLAIAARRDAAIATLDHPMSRAARELGIAVEALQT
jgi:predicted nucleic acid-binding protein